MENILFPARIQGRDMKEHRQRALDLIEMVGLTGFADKKPTQLSGGMRQRVAICRALVTDPRHPFDGRTVLGARCDDARRDERRACSTSGTRSRRPGSSSPIPSAKRSYLSDRVLVMTRRPATIIEDLRVPFARSRDPRIGETREFNELCGHLRGLIEHRESPRRRMGQAA